MTRSASRRLRRETRTVEVMIRMYCHDLHAAGRPGDTGELPARGRSLGLRTSLCPDCAALLQHTLERIDACRFGAEKPTCARCTVHCFRASMREQIRAAMRHSGPRMTYRHPYLAARHVMDRRQQPDDAVEGQ